jgi:tetratricopeptide (TPR) repeat protein
MADVGALIDIAEALTQCNAHMAAVFLPDLIAAGSNAHLSPSVRVSALGVAGAILRSSGSVNAAEDALDLADTAEMIAKGSRKNLVCARAAYESARASLFALPNESETYLADLERAERFAERETGPESQIRLGWCAYTRCLIDEGTDLKRADEHAHKALDLFEANDFHYGMAAALTALTHVRYTISEREGTARLALRALSIANSHGYLRIMAESAFWAGELLSDEDPDQADRLFTSAAEHFQAVGSSQWSALAYASRALTREQRRVGELDVDQAERLLAVLRDLQSNTSSNETSWAAAVLKRRIAALARRAQKYAVAEREFGESLEIYEATASAPGLAMARAGLIATEREHAEVRKDDVVDALRGSGSPFSGLIPQAAVSAVKPLEYESSYYELGSI